MTIRKTAFPSSWTNWLAEEQWTAECHLYNGKQPGLPWCSAAGGPAASHGGVYLW